MYLKLFQVIVESDFNKFYTYILSTLLPNLIYNLCTYMCTPVLTYLLPTHPGDEAMAQVLGHDLVALQLLEEDALVEGGDVLQVAEDDVLLAAKRRRHLTTLARPHRQQEGVDHLLQVLHKTRRVR